MAARPTLSALTGLRFLAALHVVFFHYTDVPLKAAPGWIHNIIGAGLTGVDLFFILSGFVLAYNYLDGRRIDRREFWLARFARIYPAHLLGVLMLAPFIAYAHFASLPPSAAAGKVATEATLALTLTQAWVPGEWPIWNGPAWSLGAEAFFYALFPLLGIWILRIRGRWLPVALIAFWMLALIRPASNIMINSLSWAPIGYANPLLRLPEFLMGIALGRLFITYGRWRFGGILANTGLFGFLAVIGIGVLGINGFLARTALRFVNVPFLYEALLLVFLALLIYGLAHGRGILAKLLSLPVMLALGEASYAVYILQIPVAAWVKGLTEHRMDPMMMPNIKFFDSLPYFLAYLAILVMVSIISHRAIESPARTAIKRTFGRKGRERTVVDASATPPVPVAPVAAEAGKLS